MKVWVLYSYGLLLSSMHERFNSSTVPPSVNTEGGNSLPWYQSKLNGSYQSKIAALW